MAVCFEEAFERITGAARQMPGEWVALEHALGRTVARDVPATRDHPPYDRAAMDGYAVAEEVVTSHAPRLRVLGRQQAGTSPLRLSGGPTCVKVMTGSVAPKGTAAIIPVEDVTEDGEEILVRENAKFRRNVCPKGEDAKAGQLLVRAGETITPVLRALLAANGYARVRARKRPSVAVFSSGQEVVPLGQKPNAWQVVDCNSWSVCGLLSASGLATPESLGVLPDEPKALRRRLGKALERHDVVVVSGGVSKGDFDYVPEVVGSLGARELVHGVATKPGRPLFVAQKGKKIVFGLPGNPVAVLATMCFYVTPFLNRMAGREPLLRLSKARLAEETKREMSRTSWLLCRFSISEDGARIAEPLPHHGSGDVPSLAGAQGFVVVNRGEGRVKAGELVDVLEW